MMFALCAAPLALAPPTVRLGDFVVQRAIQQQLYFIAELKNEPVQTWLAKFQGHEHLESVGRKPGAPGNPGSYSAEFGQLRTTPYTAYLSAMGDAPDDVVKVEFQAPRRKLSARELQNPFLVAEENEKNAQKEWREVGIYPVRILTQLLTTADVIADTWAFHLGELEVGDAARVAMDRAPTKAMVTPEMLRDALLASEGGETGISWYTDDEPLPLHALDHRACDRLVTLRALESLVNEVTALTPETAFASGYPQLEQPPSDDDGDEVPALVVERRRKRLARRQASFAVGDDMAKAAAARVAALDFLEEDAAYWVPKLTKGDERSALQKRESRPEPGMKERPRPADTGADADAALEDLWAWMDGSPFHIHGGELVTPARMGTRLRELRATHAADAQRELTDEILLELTRARIAYTDYTEEDERLRLERKKADAEAELVWKIDPSFQGLNEG